MRADDFAKAPIYLVDVQKYLEKKFPQCLESIKNEEDVEKVSCKSQQFLIT